MKAVSLRNVDDFEQRALWQSVKFPFKLSERMRIIDFTQKGGYKMYKIDALQFGHRGIAGMVQEEDRPPICAPIRGGAGSIKSSEKHKVNEELLVDSAVTYIFIFISQSALRIQNQIKTVPFRFRIGVLAESTVDPLSSVCNLSVSTLHFLQNG